MADLGEFEGRDVLQAAIKVTNAGDGLSKAVAVDSRAISLDEEVYVVLKTSCVRVEHEDLKDSETVKRMHVLRTASATIVPKDLVGTVIAEQEDRIRKAEEDAAGVLRLESVADEAAGCRERVKRV